MRIFFFSYFFLISFKFLYAGAFTESSAASSASGGLSAPNTTLIPIENIAVTGSIYLGKQIYESGGFATFGLIPESFKKSSPIAYNENYQINSSMLKLKLCKENIDQINYLNDSSGLSQFSSSSSSCLVSNNSSLNKKDLTAIDYLND